MKSYARLQNGAVAEFLSTSADIGTLFNPQVEWIDVSGAAHVEIGWTWEQGTGFSPPSAELAISASVTPPQLADLHAQLLALQAQLAALSSSSDHSPAQ